MSTAIGLRGDFGAARLRAIAKQAKDGPQARRLLVLALIYEGATHRGGGDRRCDVANVECLWRIPFIQAFGP